MSDSTIASEPRAASPHKARGFAVFVGIASSAMLLGAVSVGALFSPLADVNRVEVSGLHRLTLDEVQQRLGFGSGVALVSLDFVAAHEALRPLAWFGDASFERSLGGTVVVRITEQRPVAVAQNSTGDWVVISRLGRVLSEPLPAERAAQFAQPDIEIEAGADLSRLTGVIAPGGVGSYLHPSVLPLLDVAAVLSVSNIAHSTLWKNDLGEIWFGLGGGHLVALGDGSRLSAKLAALLTLIDEIDLDLEPRRGPASPESAGEELPDALEIDVSVPHLPVVRTIRSEETGASG